MASTKKSFWQHPHVVTTACFYMLSGLPLGIVQEWLGLYLRQQDVSLTIIGLFSWVQLPWSCKVFIAPWVDCYAKPRLWMRSLLLTMALCHIALGCLILYPMPISQRLLALFVLFVIYVTASASHDLMLDGLFIEWWQGPEVGFANSLRSNSYRLALILSGMGSLWLQKDLGWGPSMFVWAPVFCLGMWYVTAELPNKPLGQAAHTQQHYAKTLKAWLLDSRMFWVLLLAFSYRFADFSMAPMLRPFWLDKGFSVMQIASVNTTLGIVCSMLGAVIGALYMQYQGIFRALYFFGILQVASNLLYVWADFSEQALWQLYVFSAVENLCQGMGNAALLSLLTQVCSISQAVAQYAILAALVFLSRLLSGALSGLLADQMGYAGYFLLSFFFGLPTFYILWRVQSFYSSLLEKNAAQLRENP